MVAARAAMHATQRSQHITFAERVLEVLPGIFILCHFIISRQAVIRNVSKVCSVGTGWLGAREGFTA